MLDGRDPSVDQAHPLSVTGVGPLPSAPRRGRPPQAEQTIPISIRIPVSVYDAYIRASLAERGSTRGLMREALVGYAPILFRRRRRR